MEQEIIKILKNINPYVEFDSDTDLIENEVIDSLGVLLLLTEIEKKYGIVISMERLEPDNLRTVKRITNWVAGLI